MGLLARLWRVVRRHQFDVSLVSVLLVLHFLGFGQAPDVGVGASLLDSLPIVALLFRRVSPPAVAITYGVTEGLSVLLDLPDASSAPTVVVIVAGAYSAGAYLSLPRGLATVALWWATVLIDFAAGRETGGITDFLFAGLILGCAFVPGVVAQRLRRQAASDRAALDAAATEKQQAHVAVAAERARIARELHDVVAHAVSIMVVQAAAADEVLERDPARAHSALRAVQDAGRSAVTEMARMLDLLRGAASVDDLEPLPTLDELDRVVEDARLAGAFVVLERGPVPPLPAALELCVVRVVQEALTNAAKHADHPRVSVRLASTEGGLDVVVEDDGGSGPLTGTGTGHGLLGLRERVEVFEGTLEASPRPGGGFQVRVALPIAGT
ncbi:MAG TPA: histidine kinase [Nocardioides sp.]|nr:histidine kinase [Nocardioides sp.]